MFHIKRPKWEEEVTLNYYYAKFADNLNKKDCRKKKCKCPETLDVSIKIYEYSLDKAVDITVFFFAFIFSL